MSHDWETEVAFKEWNEELEADLKLNPNEYFKQPKRELDPSLTFPNRGGPQFVYYYKMDGGNNERLIRRPNVPHCPTVVQMDGRPVDYLEQKGFKRIWGDELRELCARQQQSSNATSEANEKKDTTNEAPKRGRPRNSY